MKYEEIFFFFISFSSASESIINNNFRLTLREKNAFPIACVVLT